MSYSYLQNGFAMHNFGKKTCIKKRDVELQFHGPIARLCDKPGRDGISYDSFSEAIAYWDTPILKTITLDFDSQGGDLREGRKIANTIGELQDDPVRPVHFVGRISRVAGSAALLAFLACDEREIHPDGVAMAHAPHGYDDTPDGRRQLFADKLDMACFIDNRCGLSLRQVSNWLEGRDCWFNAKEAVLCGLAHRITPFAQPLWDPIDIRGTRRWWVPPEQVAS